MTESRQQLEDRETPDEGIRCDFCGEIVSAVRRVALDEDYERLRTTHREQYACPTCSDAKEQQRLGLDRG